MLASIPSPDSGVIELGPVTLHLYGLTLLAAIGAAILLTGLRLPRAERDWDLIFRVAVWGVAAGIVGARIWHVLTSWDQVPDPKWQGVFKVWEGGLGVWGGIAAGVLVGALVIRRARGSIARWLDLVAPGLLLAQAVGRVGNWWNQELFGDPTGRPWALEIDPENRPEGYAQFETFHPTFLYELLYNLVGVAVLLVVDRRFRLRPPALFALYVAFYSAGRFCWELLRIDPSHEFAGLRLNAWVALLMFVGASLFFLWWQVWRPRRAVRTREVKRPTMAIPRGRVRQRH